MSDGNRNATDFAALQRLVADEVRVAVKEELGKRKRGRNRPGGQKPLSHVIHVVGRVGETTEKVAARMLRALPPGKQLSCRKGCSFCCYLQVATDIPTVIRIVEHMRTTFTPQALAEARRRIEERHAAWLATTPGQRLARLQRCPLLVDGNCSVYAARPAYCRTWHSFDVTKCEASYNHPEAPVTIPAYKPLLVMALHVEGGVEQGLFRSGLDPHTVDLVPALWLAFNIPDADARWLAGEDVFEPAWLLDSDH
jgi:Fe-S-cluster containining protein